MRQILGLFTVLGILLIFGGCERRDGIEKEQLAPVLLTAFVNRTQPALSQRFEFRIKLDYDKKLGDLRIPEVGGQIQGLRILEPLQNPQKVTGDRIYKEKGYALMADQIGAFILPTVTLEFELDGESKKVETTRLFIDVSEGSAGDASELEELRDIAPIAKVHFDRDYRGFWGLGFLSAVLALAGILGMRARREEEIVGFIAPDEWAEEALAELDESDFLAKGQPKRFYQELSRILRGYLKRRFEVASEEATVEELLPLIRRIVELTPALLESLSMFFREADLAKFAEIYRPLLEIHQSRTWVGEFVLQTREEEEEPGEVPGAILNHESAA